LERSRRLVCGRVCGAGKAQVAQDNSHLPAPGLSLLIEEHPNLPERFSPTLIMATKRRAVIEDGDSTGGIIYEAYVRRNKDSRIHVGGAHSDFQRAAGDGLHGAGL
jgi:hypothetical protein